MFVFPRPVKPARIAWARVAEAATGLSQADLVRAADEVIKGAILRDEASVSTDELIKALRERLEVRETVAGILDT